MKTFKSGSMLGSMMMLLLASALVGCGELPEGEDPGAAPPVTAPSLLETAGTAPVDQGQPNGTAPSQLPSPPVPEPALPSGETAAALVVGQPAAPSTSIELLKGGEQDPRSLIHGNLPVVPTGLITTEPPAPSDPVDPTTGDEQVPPCEEAPCPAAPKATEPF